MTDITFASPQDCRNELERVSNEFSRLIHGYVNKRQRLADIQKILKPLRARTLLQVDGPNKEAREAQVEVALLDREDTKALVVEEFELKSTLEILGEEMDVLKTQGTHAQSAVRAHDQESRFVNYGEAGR